MFICLTEEFVPSLLGCFGVSDIHTCENDKYQSGFKAVISGAKSIFRNAIKNGVLLILNWVK